MLKFIITSLLLLVGSFSFAQNLDYSLTDCIDSALKNNLQLRQNEVLMQSSAVGLKQAKENLLPNVNGNINYGFNSGRNVDPITNTYTNNQYSSSNASLNANVVLFNGLRLQNFISQKKYESQAANLDFQQQKENLMLNVMLAYVQVLNNEDLLSISKTQLAITQKQVDRMGILVKEGAVGLYQLTDVKGQLATEKINIINAERDLKQSKLVLCQLMNVNYNPLLSLQRLNQDDKINPYPFSSHQIIESAMLQMPLVKSNELKTKGAMKNIQTLKGNLYPILSLNGSTGSSYSSSFKLASPTTISEQATGNYIKNGTTRTPVYQEVQNYSFRDVSYTNQLDNNLGYFVGLNLQIPLFNNFRVRNQLILAKLDFKNVKLNAELTNDQLIQDIEQAHLNMETAYQKYEMLAEQFNNFEESFRSAEIRFNSGVINATEFLITKSKFDNVKINLTQAGYEYILRKRILNYYKGDL